MSYRFFRSHTELIFTLLDVKFSGIESSFSLIELTLELRETCGSIVYLIKHIH